MAKAFSVASWNIESLSAHKRPIDPIVQFIAAQNADIVAIYEATSKEAFAPLLTAMPKYQFHITEGPQTQEILVGIRNGLSAYVTQRVEFRSGQSTLRPGLLVTVKVEDVLYPVLFLHLKSMTDPKGMGLRDDQLQRAFKFCKTLNDGDRARGGPGRAHYLFLGDLNTMGMDYPYEHDIPAADELKRMQRRASYRKMRVLAKNGDYTWWNGPASTLPKGNLDHVVAAKHLTFRSFGGADVDVRGWPKEPTEAAEAAWIDTYSDHALLYFEVQRV